MGEAAPTPGKIDELALEYLELAKKAEALEHALKAKADQLTPIVEAHGSAHGKKSKLLVGASYEMMTTTSSSTSIDAAAVERIKQALLRVKQLVLFKKLFREVKSYQLAPGADAIMRDALPKGSPRNLRTMFSRAVLTETKPPRLSDVRPRKGVPADSSTNAVA